MKYRSPRPIVCRYKRLACWECSCDSIYTRRYVSPRWQRICTILNYRWRRRSCSRLRECSAIFLWLIVPHYAIKQVGKLLLCWRVTGLKPRLGNISCILAHDTINVDPTIIIPIPMATLNRSHPIVLLSLIPPFTSTSMHDTSRASGMLIGLHPPYW